MEDDDHRQRFQENTERIRAGTKPLRVLTARTRSTYERSTTTGTARTRADADTA